MDSDGLSKDYFRHFTHPDGLRVNILILPKLKSTNWYKNIELARFLQCFPFFMLNFKFLKRWKCYRSLAVFTTCPQICFAGVFCINNWFIFVFLFFYRDFLRI